MTLIQKLRKSKYGFTLIELIVVLAIIAILAMILIPSMVAYLRNSQKRQEESDTRSAYSAACSAYNTVITDGKTYASDAAFSEAIIAETQRLIRNVAVNPPVGNSGHIDAVIDRDRGIVTISLTSEAKCVCTYDAAVDKSDFNHSFDGHK